ERREPPLEHLPDVRVGGIRGEVPELPRIALEVVQLAPAVLVLDVDVAQGADAAVRRRPALPQQAPAQVLDDEAGAPPRALAAQERDEAAPVLRQARRDAG